MTTLEEMKTLLIHMQNVIGNMTATNFEPVTPNIEHTKVLSHLDEDKITLEEASIITGIETTTLSALLKEKGFLFQKRGRFYVISLTELMTRLYCRPKPKDWKDYGIRHFKGHKISGEYENWVMDGIRNRYIGPSKDSLNRFGLYHDRAKALIQKLVDEGVLIYTEARGFKIAIFNYKLQKGEDGNGSDLDNS